MKKAILIYLFIAVLGFVLFPAILQGCTDNQRARSFGGTETIDLPKGQRLVNATWKGEKGGADLWYLTEPMPVGYVPQNKTFQEYSNLGIMNGTVIFVESN